MHATFLGEMQILIRASADHSSCSDEVKHIVQEILIGGGLFTARSRTNKPMERLETFLARLEWPASVGRVPNNVSSFCMYSIHSHGGS